MSRALVSPRPLLAGLLLGTVSTWAVFQLHPASTTRPAPVASSPLPLPFPSGTGTSSSPASLVLLPPPLADAEAGEALAAYLALPPLDPKAPEAEIRERLDRLRALLTVLPSHRLPHLLETLALREGPAEVRLRRAAFEVWTEQDAPAAARWALTIVPRPGFDAPARARYTTQAVVAWARENFAAAYAWAAAVGEPKLARDLQARLLGQLATTDPHQALALAAHGDADFLLGAQRAVFDAWAERDPVSALKTLGPTLFQNRESAWRVQKALTKWIARDPSAALEWTLALPPASDDDSARSPLLHVGWALAQTNPDAVGPLLDLVHRRQDIPARTSTIRNLLGAWVYRDPDAAARWLDTLPDAAERSDYIGRCLNYVGANPDAFLTLARRLPESADRDQKIADHISSWVERDPDAAFAWLETTHDPALTAIAPRLEGLHIGQLAATDPATAVTRWQTLPPAAQNPILAAQIATHWGKSDPAAATTWLLEQLPTNPGDDNAAHQAYAEMANLAGTWIRRDLPGYLAWAQQMPPGPRRDFATQALSAVSAFYIHLPDDPPPRAAFADQLANIEDYTIRQQALHAHIHAWLRSDVRAARAWLEGSDALSPEVAARLLAETTSSP